MWEMSDEGCKKFLAQAKRQEDELLEIIIAISEADHKPENFTPEELQRWTSAADPQAQYTTEQKGLGPMTQEQFTEY